MQTRRSLLAAMAAAALLVAGCNIETINSFPPHPAHVRVANFVVGAPSIDFTANGNVDWPSVAFGTASAARDYNNELTEFAFRPTGGTDLSNVEFALAGEQAYTLVGYGSTTTLGPGIVVLADTSVVAREGTFQSRVVNIAGLAVGLDVYVTNPGDSIDNITPRFSNVAHTGVTGYLGSSSGQARIRIAYNTVDSSNNTVKNLVYDSGTVTLPDAGTADVVVYTVGSNALVNVALLGIGSGAPNTLLANALAQYRIVNAAPQAASVRSLVDGTSTTTGTAYPGYSPYKSIAAGSHTVAVENEATPGATLASVTRNFAPGTDTTIVLTGNAGSNVATAYADTNLATSAVSARFVNASPDAPAVQIVANDTVVVQSLARNQASDYVIMAGGTYTFTIKNASTGAVLATVTDALLTATQTDTILVVGPVSTLGLLFANDR